MSTKGDKDLFFEQVDLLCGDIDDPLEQAKIIQAFVGMPEKERKMRQYLSMVFQENHNTKTIL